MVFENDEHVVICSIFIIINQIILLVGKYSTWWFYFYYSLILSFSIHLFPILFNNIIYQSTVLSAILVYQIWIIQSKSILISKFISNTSYSMKYDRIITYNNHLFYQFLIYTRSARIVETSILSFIFIQILVIDLDRTYLNDLGRWTVWRLGISVHHSIIQYQTRKSYWTRRIETISIRSDGC